MERRTLGSFLAALRKAKGLTQQQLADLLHVSNKAVSRWERDECAPDLSLIPVIADLFGVTADELLRGQRAAPGETPTPSPRRAAELLTNRLMRFRSLSYIAAALTALGLLAMLVCAYAFYQPVLGCGLALACFLASAVLEQLGVLQARSGLDADVLGGLDAAPYRAAVARWQLGCAWGNLAGLACCLPFVCPPTGTGSGSVAAFGAWLAALPLYLAGAALAGAGPWALLARELYPEPARRPFRLMLLRHAGVTLTLLLAALVLQYQILPELAPRAGGRTFTAFEPFRAFMEAEPSEDTGDGIGVGRVELAEERPETLEIDGVTYSYVWRNLDVAEVRWGSNGGFPVTVFTQGDLRQALRRRQLGNACLHWLYPLGALAGLLSCRRRARPGRDAGARRGA